MSEYLYKEYLIKVLVITSINKGFYMGCFYAQKNIAVSFYLQNIECFEDLTVVLSLNWLQIFV